jgi:hypothetical protein
MSSVMLKILSCSRRLFSGLTVVGMLLAAVIVVAVADPTVSPVQAAPGSAAEMYLSQIGANIDGEAASDESGSSVALSDDGLTAIIGAPGSNSIDSGQARIYRWNGAVWVQRGTAIHGEAAGDYFGYSVALSADGLTAIIGAPSNDGTGGVNSYSGHARIYEWDGTGWLKRGDDIDGEAAGDQSGWSVALSADGDTAIIGAPYNDGTVVDSNSGHARIYTWNSSSTAWVPQGGDIDGEAIDDYSGYSVALSANGDTAIIGAPSNDGVNGADSGHARIYKLINSVWVPQGAAIDGEAAGDQSGWSVALSADGLTAIIGAPTNDGTDSNSGHARIYTWNSSSTAWVQRGADIDGEAAEDHSGRSVALSDDGGTALIGAPYNDNDNDNDPDNGSGHARIYKLINSVWVPQGADIDGEAASDQFGFSVALSADGLTAIIGAPSNDGDDGTGTGGVNIDSGHARIVVARLAVVADIDGEAAKDKSGYSVALSADGLTAIIGAPYNDNDNDPDNDSGQARIYTWNGTAWVQRGADIDGEAPGDHSGWSVALSADGLTAIIGAPKNDGDDGTGTGGVNIDSGHARIYKWSGAAWVQRGADIDGEAAGDHSGWSVALSADGLTAIIGARHNDGGGGGGVNSESGHARIYTWNDGAWEQLGGDIDGEADFDWSGSSVALSADGLTAIIGAPYHDGDDGAGGVKGNSGHARIYTWINSAWVQRGANIDGEAADDYSGWSVALSADGLTAIIGAPNHGGTGRNSGHARIYVWINSAWVQRGADIDGEAAGDYSGSSVALSADGLTAIIGAPNHDGGGGNPYLGHARIYVWDGAVWVQRGADIDGEAAYDQSGWSVALSADGLTAIIGAPNHDGDVGDGGNSGHARIYRWLRVSTPAMPNPAGAMSSQPGTAVVSWAPGLAYEYGPVTAWQVEQSGDGGVSWSTATLAATPGAAATAATVTGLTNGVEYRFRVAGINKVGKGPSAVSNTATPAAPVTATVPSAPRTVVATAGDRSATVVWSAPASTGGSPITGYIVTAHDGATCSTTGALTCTVTDLDNDTRYTFTVIATNDVGSSAPSQASATVMPVSPPIVFVPFPPYLGGLSISLPGSFLTVTIFGCAINEDLTFALISFTLVATCVSSAVVSTPGAAALTVGTGTASATFTAPSAPGDYEVTVTGSAGFTGSVPISVIPVVPSVPVLPGRVFESRSGSADFVTVDGLFQGAGRTGAGEVVEVQVTGRAGVPVNAEAVFLNVVAVSPSGPGYLTVFPCGATPPLAANVNYNTGDIAANAVFAKIDDDGKVCVYTHAETDLVIDVNGYTPAGADTKSVVPGRVLESRSGNGLITADGLFQGVGRTGAGEVREVQVTGRAGVPVNAEAVFLNVVAVSPSGPGFLTVFPCGATPPLAANVNYNTGDIAANAVFAKIGDDGKVCVYTHAETDLVIDVNGYTPAT